MVECPLVAGRRGSDYGWRRPCQGAGCLLDEIRSRERNGLIELPKPPSFRPSDRIQITRGALQGHIGFYAGTRVGERIEILLGLLGGQQRAVLAKSDITTVEMETVPT